MSIDTAALGPQRLILASQSKARRKLMKELGIPFECHVSGYEEDMNAYKSPKSLAKHLALGKAIFIAKKFPNSIIIGADTFITIPQSGGRKPSAQREGAGVRLSRRQSVQKKIGKPATIKEAEKIIRAMSGKTIQVHSGIAVIKTNAQGKIIRKIVEHVVTKLKIKKMTPQEISHLAHQEEALQISGAFSIEGEGGKMVQKIDGDYNNVIGLPLFQLKKMLKTVSYHHISSRTSS